jgi:hypothetical protein
MAIADDKTRIYTTITKEERKAIDAIIAARKAEGLKATASSIVAECVRFTLASKVTVRND